MAEYAVFAGAILGLYRAPIRRKKTRAALSQVLGEFASICPTTEAVTPDAIARWIAAYPGRSPIRSFGLLRSFATACRLGFKMRLLETDPFSIRRPAEWWSAGELEPEDRPRHLSLDSARALDRRATEEARDGSWEALRLLVLVRL